MKDVKEKVRAKLLQLSRETLHPLNDGKLVHVGGACDTTTWTTEIVAPQACYTTSWTTDSPH